MTAVELAAAIRFRCSSCLPGMRLPGRGELAAYFRCPESMVRSAIDELARDGLLDCREREGCFIRATQPPKPIRQIRALTDHEAFQPAVQGILLGVSDECRIRRLDLAVDSDPRQPLTFSVLSKLAGGDPLTVGWVAVLSKLPSDEVMYSWLGAGVPFVIADDYPSIMRVNLVTRDTRRAVFLATEHLLRLGHRRIVLAGPQDHSLCGQERVTGFRLAMEQRGAPCDPRLILWASGKDDQTFGSRLGPLLRGPARATGVVGADQYAGCEALAVCQSLRLRVPEDVSVASAGLQPRFVPPLHERLSRMDEGPAQRIGQMAVQLLLDSHTTGRSTAAWIAPTWVDRGSTGPPRS